MTMALNVMNLKSLAVLFCAAALLSGCERPIPDVKQLGYRGTGMAKVDNPRTLAKLNAAQVVPEAPAPVPADGPKAKDIYQNVQVLGELGVGEFTRTMTAITAWVAPKEGCAYCHNLANLAEDTKYTKVVARKMVQMTLKVNTDWASHHNGTGVTCWTCHRGNAVPANVWFKPTSNTRTVGLMGDDAGQNKASKVVAGASLPYDPFTPYLSDNKTIADIRVNGKTPLPTGNRHSIKQAEHTFALMVHMSSSLGVNCNFCHNSNSGFQSWDGPVQRVNAYYGIRMVGELNAGYLTPLQGVFPAERLGPAGDVAKVNCSTCHQGVNKPLNGAKMAKDYPALLTTAAPAAAASAPMDAAPVKTTKAPGQPTLVAAGAESVTTK